jgi:hypothetical protein
MIGNGQKYPFLNYPWEGRFNTENLFIPPGYATRLNQQ